MRDVVHTNQQRIDKVRSVFKATQGLEETLRHVLGADHQIVLTLEGINAEVIEAEGSLSAIEKFLGDRNALEGIE